MSQKKGVRNVGNEYEPKVIAYLAIALSQNLEVKSYSLHTSLKDVPGFDDIIAEVYYRNEEHPHIYLIQIKHRNKKINFDNENYQLRDYKGFISQIIGKKSYIDFLNVPEENIEYWLFSNKSIQGSIHGASNTALKKLICECIPRLGLEGCYQFKDQYKSVCHPNFYFYLNQPDNWQIENHLRTFYQEKFSREMIQDIISFLDRYFHRKEKQIPWLTKDVFETELLKIHLSNCIVKPTITSDMNTKVVRFWNELVLKHEVTIVEDEKGVESSIFGCILKQINEMCKFDFKWNHYVSNGCKLENYNKEMFNFQRTHFVHCVDAPDTLELLLLELWKNNKLPLVIKLENSFSILNSYRHLSKRFIIIGDAQKIYNNIKYSFSSIFTNASDIYDERLKNELLENLRVSLQGRKPVSLSHVIDNDEKSLTEMTCSTILHLFKKRKPHLYRDSLNKIKGIIYFVIDETCVDNNLHIETLENDIYHNIMIPCNNSDVEKYAKKLQSNSQYTNFAMYYLKLVKDKFEILKGDTKRLNNFLVDSDGEGIYYLKDLKEYIPIIGKRLEVNNMNYIERTISKATIDENIFKNVEKHKIFVLTGDVESLDDDVKQNILKQPNDSQTIINLELHNNKNLFLNIDNIQYLEKLWEQNASHKILHLNLQKGVMELVKCQNYDTDFRKYISYDKKRFKEGDFFKEINNNIIIISGEPGIGKTTLLRSLFQICNEANYALFADLADYRYHIHENIKELFDDPLDFIFNQCNYSILKRFSEAVYNSKRNKEKLTLFLDSFDEMLTSDIEKVMSLIEKIAATNTNIIISSRLNADPILIDRFKVIPFHIENLDRQDFETYLKEKKIKGKTVHLSNSQFLKNPLHLKYWYQDGQLTNSNALSAKVKTYCQKNKYCLVPKEINLTYHKLLALVYRLGKDEAIKSGIIENYEALVEKFKIYEIKVGIISYFDECNLPVFVDKIFAEYLTEQWFKEKLNNSSQNTTSYQKLINLYNKMNITNLDLNKIEIQEI